MLIQWQESLATGNPEIDAQHRELFSRIERLVNACQAGKGRQELQNLLHFLKEYALTHFSDEERLQKNCNFPGYPSHKRQHDLFIEELGCLEEQLASEGTNIALMVQSNSLVFNWLSTHIMKMDKDMAAFIRSAATS